MLRKVNVELVWFFIIPCVEDDNVKTSMEGVLQVYY